MRQGKPCIIEIHNKACTFKWNPKAKLRRRRYFLKPTLLSTTFGPCKATKLHHTCAQMNVDPSIHEALCRILHPFSTTCSQPQRHMTLPWHRSHGHLQSPIPLPTTHLPTCPSCKELGSLVSCLGVLVVQPHLHDPCVAPVPKIQIIPLCV